MRSEDDSSDEEPHSQNEPTDENPSFADWEIPDRRFHIPIDLKTMIGAGPGPIRVSQSIDRKQNRKHRSDLLFYDEIEQYVARTTHVRMQPPNEHGHGSFPRWQLAQLIEETDDRPKTGHLIVLGYHADHASWELFSLHRRRTLWWTRFVAMEGTQERGLG